MRYGGALSEGSSFQRGKYQKRALEDEIQGTPFFLHMRVESGAIPGKHVREES